MGFYNNIPYFSEDVCQDATAGCDNKVRYLLYLISESRYMKMGGLSGYSL